MTLGTKLRESRLKSDFTLEEAAKHIKVTAQTLQKYEKGVISNVPSDKIEILAEIYNTTPAYLMGWEEATPIEKLEAEVDSEILLAAHHEGEWTEEEIQQIKDYMEYVKSRRPKKNT